MRADDLIAQAITKAAEAQAKRATRVRVTTLPAEYVGRDSEGKSWVLLPGATSPTPVRRMAVEADLGDTVSVTVGNGRAVVDSNISNPSAGVAGVRQVKSVAQGAQLTAEGASKDAQAAIGYASSARLASKDAKNQAESATTSAATANEAANRAVADAATANAAAESAVADAATASASAAIAMEQADSAIDSANRSLVGLSIVEDVVGTLNWITEHGSYVQTLDTEIVEGKVYFTYDSQSGDYTPVVDPQASELPNYYELDLSDSQSDFIMAHLAVTSRGLWVLPSGMGQASDAQHAPNYKVLLSSDGMYVYDGDGVLVTTYGESIAFDSNRAQYIGSEEAYILFEPATATTKATVRIGGNVIMGDSTPLSKLMGVRYDSTWTKANGTYAFTGYAYKGGEDVSDDYDPDFFVWYLRNESGESLLGRGRTCSVAQSLAGYHGTVVGGLEDSLDCYLVDDSQNRIVTDDGAFIADLIWEV